MAILSCVLIALALPAAAQVDQRRAQDYFKDVQAVCEREGKRLWGMSMCGPMVIADLQTQTIATSQPAPEGPRPRLLGIVNAPVQWGGVTWAAYMWDTLVNASPRHAREVLLHELFHGVVQAKLGLAAQGPLPEHLDAMDGRYWLRLEWRALARALREFGAQRSAAVRDALAFRQARRMLHTAAAENERAIEITEGLAAYTGTAAAAASGDDAVAGALDLLTSGETGESFVRTFAYVSGPAYGLLLDASSPGWRQRIPQHRRLRGASGNRTCSSTHRRRCGVRRPIWRRRGPYCRRAAREAAGGTHRRAAPAVCRRPGVRASRWRRRYVEFHGRRGDSDCRDGVFRPVPPQYRLGRLEAEKGVLVESDGGVRRVAAPVRRDDTTVVGDGWTFTAKPGWVIRDGPRRGDYEVVRQP